MNTPIDPQHWQIAQQIFEEVCELPEPERTALIRERCGANSALAAGLEALVAASSIGVPESGGLWAAAKVVGDAESDVVEEVRDIPGIRIGPYRLIEQIGEGTFGVVFLAEQQHPVKRRVAVKIVKAGMDTRQIVRRFEAERQALAAMNHENIARVIDGGATEQRRPYFVMEYVRGEPITTYADRMTLNISARLRLFVTVCDAIQHAHQRGVIHRDIKPNNILVTEIDGKPTAKVIDFGVAKAFGPMLTEGTSMTERGQLVGTPEYMSPEQASLGAAETDTRSDVYSLGVVLYELIAGVLPFDWRTLRNAGLNEVLKTLREQDPPRPSTRLAAVDTDWARNIAERREAHRDSLVSDLRRELEWLPMKAMRKDPSERYQTPMELAADIERYLKGEALFAGPEAVGYRLRKFARRNRGAVAAAGAVVLALCLGLAATMWQARRAAARADTLERMSSFQSQVLRKLDAYRAGKELLDGLRTQVQQTLQASGGTEADRSATLKLLDEQFVRVNKVALAEGLVERSILEPALKALHATFPDDPAVASELRAAIAGSYSDLGNHEAARTLLREVVKSQRETFGSRDARTAISLKQLGNALHALGQFEEASTLCREALDVLMEERGSDDPDTLQAMNDLGAVYATMGKLSDAESLLVPALEGRRRWLGSDHTSTIESIGNVAVLRQKQGRTVEAGPLYQEALDTSRRVRGNDAPETIAAITNMGFRCLVEKRLDEAEILNREAVEIASRVLGVEHPYGLNARNNLGHTLLKQGRLAEAELCFEESLAHHRRILGDSHGNTLGVTNNLGSVLLMQGELGRAEQLLRGALASFSSSEVSPDIRMITLTNLGRVLCRQERFTEAAAMLGGQESLARTSFVGGNAPRLGIFLSVLGRARARTGDPDFDELKVAEANLLDAYPILVKSLGGTHQDTRDCAEGLADLYSLFASLQPDANYQERATEWRAKAAPADAGQ